MKSPGLQGALLWQFNSCFFIKFKCENKHTRIARNTLKRKSMRNIKTHQLILDDKLQQITVRQGCYFSLMLPATSKPISSLCCCFFLIFHFNHTHGKLRDNHIFYAWLSLQSSESYQKLYQWYLAFNRLITPKYFPSKIRSCLLPPPSKLQ